MNEGLGKYDGIRIGVICYSTNIGAKLTAIVPIVLYYGTNKCTCARNLKDIINESQLFWDNILDFKYILVDINR